MKSFKYSRFLRRLENNVAPLIKGKGSDYAFTVSFTEQFSDSSQEVLQIVCKEMPDGTTCCAPVQPDGSWKCPKGPK